MALTAVEKLREAFSNALEKRAPDVQDVVTNSNAITTVMKERGMWKVDAGGPTLRVPVRFGETGSYVRYNGSDFLNPAPKEIINDAEFEWKMAAVSIALTGEEILKNSGNATQIRNVFTTKMEAAEDELVDRFTEDLHGDGTADSGKQIGGLQLAIPTTTNSGTYGGFSRVDNAQWRTTTYDIDNDFTDYSYTQLTSSNVYHMFNIIIEARSRGKRGPDLIVSSAEHYHQFALATQAIQRIVDTDNNLGKLGFRSQKFYGSGKSVDVVCEGGIGSAMPANTSYFIDMKSLGFHVHPDRNFASLGPKQMPLNQDMVVQHVGFMGNLVMKNPIHMAKLYDSDPAS